MPQGGPRTCCRAGTGLRPDPRRGADPIGDGNGSEWHVARADPLCAGHQVGGEAVALAAEPAAEPPEARDHLVRDQEDAALAADPLDRRPVAVRRRDRAAGPDQWLADERRCRVPERVERPGEVVGIVVRDLGATADQRAEAVADRGMPDSEVP